MTIIINNIQITLFYKVIKMLNRLESYAIVVILLRIEDEKNYEK